MVSCPNSFLPLLPCDFLAFLLVLTSRHTISCHGDTSAAMLSPPQAVEAALSQNVIPLALRLMEVCPQSHRGGRLAPPDESGIPGPSRRCRW